MKRAHQEIVQEGCLYWLPHEVLTEILRLVFTGIGMQWTETVAAFRTRETSRLIKLLVERELIGRVKTIQCYRTLSCLTDDGVCCFTGLTRLNLLLGYTLTYKAFSRLTRLEELSVIHTTRELPNRCLEPFKCLRKLTLIIQGQGAHKLDLSLLADTLETLVLQSNTLYTNADVCRLVALKTLELHEDRAVSGECFYAMPKLETLVLNGNSMLRKQHIENLAPRLLDLRLIYNTQIENDTVLCMTRLERLSIIHRSMIEYTTLQRLTNLTELSVPSSYHMTRDKLSMLPRLKSLNLPLSSNKIDLF